ncbi:MAG: hypothetical protein GXP56_16675 [Deltaproteobacteria bacterium]|nr:hypothetical protein [Deltaproteobacteria bacterium]
MIKKKFPVFLFAFFILLPGVGEAFIPQAPHLLYLVMEKIRQPAGIEAFQTKKILNYKDPGKGFNKLEEKLYFLYPGRFRCEITSETLTSFSVESDHEFVKVMDGIIVSHEKSPVDLYTDILLYRDHESLLNRLAEEGIDTTEVSLQRYNDIICYVIGRPLEKGKPFAGLWIEKDTFLPMKYMVEKNGYMVEIFYHNWRRVSKTWYPMQVVIFLDNQLSVMVDVKSFDLKSGFLPSLFDIDHIKKLYPENNPGFQDENSKQVDELDKRIEDFNKLYK